MQLISNYPWYFTLLCIVTGFLFSAFLYARDKKNADRSGVLLSVLFALRFISVTLICLLLLDFLMKQLVNETEKPVIVFVQDNSSSVVNAKDSDEIRKNYLQALPGFINRLKEKYEVNTYVFDNTLRAGDTYNFNGKETDIAGVFSDIENNYANRNVGAVILASDGIYNKGLNPLYTTTKFNYPVYTIALGDTTPLKDVWIQNLRHNQVAYLGNSFPLEVVVNATDLQGKDVTVTVSQNGQVKKAQPLHIGGANFSQTLSFILEADKPGVQKYTVTISAIADDKNKQNNAQSFVIDVIDNREKILILANAPHPDIAAIEQSISSNQSYETEIAMADNFQKPLKPYSLVILHQLPAGAASQRFLTELKNNNQPYWVIGVSPNDFIRGLQVRMMSSKWNDAEAVYKKEFALFTVSDELKKYMKDFPAVKCILGNYEVSNSFSTLAAQRIGVVNTENPILVFGEDNGVKKGAFLGDGLWRWRLRDYADHQNHNLFNELITKTIQYLAVKADKSFFRVYTKKIINENEPLDFTAEVYNQSYEQITDPDVNLVLKDSAGKSYNYTFSKKQTSYILNAGMFPPGEYSYKAQTKTGDKVFEKSGVVVIREIVAEKLNTVADHNLLYQLSKQSGGKMVYKQELDKLAADMLNSDLIKTITYSHKKMTDLLNLKWICLLLIALLSIEWFLRKYNGTI
ncbi:MAG: hypothetical protein JST26_00825 [Bacteroidetes bacterium]|nr:hypothetical protein [Bacteroidota bacterium]